MSVPYEDIVNYIEQCPKPKCKATPNDQITTGDSHGHPFHYLHNGQQFNVIEIPADGTYEALKKIYDTPINKITREHIDLFPKLLDSLKVNNIRLWRTLGDNFYERSHCDLWLLFIFRFLQRDRLLQQDRIAMENMLSNHDLLMLLDLENKTLFDEEPRMGNEFCRSWFNLGILVKKGLISEKEVRELVDTYVKPIMRLVSYSIDRSKTIPTVRVFMHAVCGLEVPKQIAKMWNIPFKTDTLQNFCDSIDAINAKFLEVLKSNQLSSVVEYEKFKDEITPPVNLPFLRLVWAREPDKDTQWPEKLNEGTAEEFNLEDFRGHERQKPQQNKPISLDMDFGYTLKMQKSLSRFNVSNCAIFLSTEHFPDLSKLSILCNDSIGGAQPIWEYQFQLNFEGTVSTVSGKFTPSQPLLNHYKVWNPKTTSNPWMSSILFTPLIEIIKLEICESREFYDPPGAKCRILRTHDERSCTPQKHETKESKQGPGTRTVISKDQISSIKPVPQTNKFAELLLSDILQPIPSKIQDPFDPNDPALPFTQFDY